MNYNAVVEKRKKEVHARLVLREKERNNTNDIVIYIVTQVSNILVVGQLG